MPAADFAADELLYLPRNMRSHRLYGFSAVVQIALTINIVLRREQAPLDDYNTGAIPGSVAICRRIGPLIGFGRPRFMPAEFRLTETPLRPVIQLRDRPPTSQAWGAARLAPPHPLIEQPALCRS